MADLRGVVLEVEEHEVIGEEDAAATPNQHTTKHQPTSRVLP